MPTVYLKAGTSKVLLEEGKAARSSDCCCDCDACDGVTVWSDAGVSGCAYADVTITLPRCAVSWTYHFAPNSSADRFTVNGVEYSGCTPLFGSPLPAADGTVAVSVSGRTLHIVVECSCATPPARNSTWSGYIICNVP